MIPVREGKALPWLMFGAVVTYGVLVGWLGGLTMLLWLI